METWALSMAHGQCSQSTFGFIVGFIESLWFRKMIKIWWLHKEKWGEKKPKSYQIAEINEPSTWWTM